MDSNVTGDFGELLGRPFIVTLCWIMRVSRSYWLFSSVKAANLVVGRLLSVPNSGAYHFRSHPSLRDEFNRGAFDYYCGIYECERNI